MGHVRSRVEVLTPQEIHRIHRASLQVLADVGVQVPNESLLARLRAVGAAVTGETALLPPALVERMLGETVARRPTPRPRGRPQPVTTCNGCETSILTYPEHERRPGTLEDVVKGIAITNALPTVSSALPVVVPADVPLPIAPLASYRLGCLYSSKPYNVYFGLGESRPLMEMAAVVAEETDRDRRALGFGFGFGIISPLRFAADDLECALLMAENGWPAGCYSFVTIGASSPASMAGALVLSNAERLACLTLMWLWRQPGYRKGFVEDPCMIEPHTLATSFAHPNLTTIAIATGQLSRYYGLGHGGGGLALSDAKLIDYQDGFERGMGAAVCILAGGGIGNSGIVGPDEAISLEQLVLDDASLAQVNWIRQGIAVNDDTLALDVIREVGIAGTYLDQEHTVRHLRREYWESPLFPRPTWSDWERTGRDTAMARAHREVERLLAAEFPPKKLLPEAAVKRLDDILRR
jgi:trimethylamine---corrinoid protein Co-methyltransferase